jgi:hypothetical protein
MTTECKNCNQSINGKFCSHCGQSADTHAINAHFLWHDIQHGLFHYEKGIPFTVKELFTHPGHSIRAYIEGKRVNHFKPISLIILLAGIYGFLYHYFHINIVSSFSEVTTSKADKLVDFKAVNEWIGTHFSIFSLLKMPLLSLATFWAFRKVGYNYIENFVLNAFLTAQGMVIRLVFLPLMIVFNETSKLPAITLLSDVISICFATWALWQFLDKLETKQKIKRIVFYYIYLTLIFILAILIASVFLAFYLKKNHPS